MIDVEKKLIRCRSYVSQNENFNRFRILNTNPICSLNHNKANILLKVQEKRNCLFPNTTIIKVVRGVMLTFSVVYVCPLLNGVRRVSYVTKITVSK